MRRSSHAFILHLCLFCFFSISAIAILGQGSAESEVHVFIDGPHTLQTNTTAEYTIQITGGFADEGGNWTYNARIEGEILGDADVEPKTGTSSGNIFKINITTPVIDQSIKLAVDGGSYINITNTTWSGEVFKDIKVFEPIIVYINATIRNPSPINVKGAVISFYVFDSDGAPTKIGNETVDVQANSTKVVSIEWLASKKDEGPRRVEVRINENQELLEFSNGDNVMDITIYIGEPPQREMRPIMFFNTGIVYIIETIAIFFIFGAYMMRRKTIRGRGYYSPSSAYPMYFEGLFMIALSIPVFAVSEILSANPDVSGDPTERMIHAILIFIFGFITILFTWDRTRKRKR